MKTLMRGFVLMALAFGLASLGSGNTASAHGHGSYHGGHGSYGSYRSYGHYYGPTWHNTSHLHYHPGRIVPHGNHAHYVPGHYHVHHTGHFHW